MASRNVHLLAVQVPVPSSSALFTVRVAAFAADVKTTTEKKQATTGDVIEAITVLTQHELDGKLHLGTPPTTILSYYGLAHKTNTTIK
jgi:hypothetical protein